MPNIHEIIRDHVEREFLRGESLVGDEQNLIEGGIIDSLGVFQLIGFLEDSFSVQVEPAEVTAENFASVDALTRFVTAKQEISKPAP